MLAARAPRRLFIFTLNLATYYFSLPHYYHPCQVLSDATIFECLSQKHLLCSGIGLVHFPPTSSLYWQRSFFLVFFSSRPSFLDSYNVLLGRDSKYFFLYILALVLWQQSHILGRDPPFFFLGIAENSTPQPLHLIGVKCFILGPRLSINE